MLEAYERLAEPHDAERRRRAFVLRAPYEVRTRSRFVATLADGREIGVQLPRGSGPLRDGELLATTTGEVVHVEAAPQPVLCIAAPSSFELMRVVYHLANRHVPAQLAETYVLIEPDPVLARLAERLGAQVEPALMPFDPEPGAYEGQHGHGHAHGEGHTHGQGDHDHDEISATVGEQLSIEAHRRRTDPQAER